MKYVFDISKTKRYRYPTHINDLVMDRSEANVSEAFIVIIEPGKAPPLHKHDDTEQLFFILEGKGELKIGDESFPVKPHDLVRVPPKTIHTIVAVSGTLLRYLAIERSRKKY